MLQPCQAAWQQMAGCSNHGSITEHDRNGGRSSRAHGVGMTCGQQQLSRPQSQQQYDMSHMT